MFSRLYPESYTPFSSPHFSAIKRYQDSIFKLLTLSTNSVTNVVRTAYFQIQARSSPLKILWQSLYSKQEALWGYPGIVRSGKMGAGKWCVTFCVKIKKTRRNIYLLLLKTSVWKEVRHFFRTVYPNRNHVTTHPVLGYFVARSIFPLKHTC